MNNSKLAIDSIIIEAKEDNSPRLQESEARTIRIITAIQEINKAQAWSTLKTEIFDGITAQLEKQLREEARKDSPDTLKLNRLAGQLKWSEKYSDLTKLEEIYRVELKNIRLQLYGKTES